MNQVQVKALRYEALIQAEGIALQGIESKDHDNIPIEIWQQELRLVRLAKTFFLAGQEKQAEGLIESAISIMVYWGMIK